MGKRRVIDSKIRSSQSFKQLTYRQRDLWQGLIETADDQGRHPGDTTFIRSIVWPYDELNSSEVEEDLAMLESVGYILRYEVGGMIYLQIVNWWKYQQSQWMSPSDYPPPPNWTDRERYHGPGNKIVTANWDRSGGFQSSRLDSGQDSRLDRTQDTQPNNPPILAREEGERREEEGEDKDSDDACLSALSVAFCNATGIPELTGGVEDWVKALDDLKRAGVEPADIEQAVTDLRAKNYSIVRLRSIVNPAINAMQKRLSKAGSVSAGQPQKIVIDTTLGYAQ